MKKYLFKIQSILFFCCLVCCVFAGCSKKDWINNIQNGGEKAELNENQSESTYKDEKNKEETETLSQQGEINQKENPITGSSTYNAESRMENYKEKGIALSSAKKENGESYCNIIWNNGRMEMFTIGPWRETGKSMIWKYTLNSDETWEREEVLWTQGVKEKVSVNRITIILGEDHNYYAYYCDENERYHLIRQAGDSFEEIVIPDWDKTKDRAYNIQPAELAVLENGKIVLVDQIGGCYIYSSDGKETLDSFLCGWCETLYVKENEFFVLENKGTSILHYDTEKMEFLPMLEGNFDSLVRLAIFEDQLFACCPEGIFRVRKDSTSFEKWMEPGKFHFSKKNGNPKKFFMLGDTFYIMYGEEEGTIKKYVPKDPKEEFLGALTVYSVETNEMIIDMIAEFRMQYPEIDVYYETAKESERSTTISDHIRALNTRILAGDGPDILVLDGLPAQSYMDKGILTDLSTMLSEVKEDLQPNILSNYIKEGHIYMLPMRFTIPMICTSGQNVEIFHSLEKFVDYCESKEQNTAITESVPYSYIIELLYYNFPPDIVSEKGDVSKENIVNFLKLVKRFCVKERAVPDKDNEKKKSYFSDRVASGNYMHGEQDMLLINMTGIYGLGTYPEEVEMQNGALLGNKGIFFPNGLLAVNELSKQKPLAEVFIKTMFSYKMQKMYTSGSGFSIHKKVLDENAKEDYSYQTYGDGTISLNYFNSKDAKRLIQIAKAVQTPVIRNQPVFEVIQEAACRYLDGKINEEEAAEDITERLSLYYLE